MRTPDVRFQTKGTQALRNVTGGVLTKQYEASVRLRPFDTNSVAHCLDLFLRRRTNDLLSR